MSIDDDNITPFRLPEDTPKTSKESFGERLRRRRNELTSSGDEAPTTSWQSRARHLTALVIESPHPAASIIRKDAAAALTVDGVESVIFSGNLPPFQNSLGREFSSEPLLAEDEVFYKGQPVAIVIGRDEKSCRLGAAALHIDYHPQPGVLSIEHAVTMGNFHGTNRTCERGHPEKEISNAPMSLAGTFTIASQEAALLGPTEATVKPIHGSDEFEVTVRALEPTAVRAGVARAAGIPESGVRVECIPLKGITDALEAEPVRLAMLATRACMASGSKVTLIVDSDHSPLNRAQRHAVDATFSVGFTKEGLIEAADIHFHMDGGWFESDSSNSMDRAILHADSVYRIPHLRIGAQLCKTNHITASCLPAEGSAQGAWIMEEIIQKVAARTGLPPHIIREKNFYSENDDLKTTPYGQPVDPSSIQRVWNQALRRSKFEERLKAVNLWNRKNPCYKRGISIVPIKFGLGDPRPERDAAAVLIQILADGSAHIRAGLVDVNDGLRGQIKEEVSNSLGIEADSIDVVLNDFEVLPRATPVTGTDAAGLVLRALTTASSNLQHRLKEVALQLFAARGQTNIELEAISFKNGLVRIETASNSILHFNEVIDAAWKKRVNLIETGYHRTPNLWWDPELGAGWPFSSFTYAAAVTEIQVDAFTGEIQILRTDIAHEGSPSANQGERDYAQLMRAYMVGAGWILSEEASPEEDEASDSRVFGDGVPGFTDAPFEIITDRLRPAGNPLTTPGAPCSEAPVLLASSIREALRDALSAFGLDSDLEINLPLPATPPKVLATFKEISRQIQEREKLSVAKIKKSRPQNP
ncbi:molybdopterin cofactor-binding domain-containing protein [Verrucomicrobiales bacterium BCK34]|nr:molybdopterin cofactor-binding domain-containing protein [Verrucomicrobiales bacterium BCK34]